MLQNILGPTPFLQAKAGLWTTTIIENILKELKEINDESAKAGQQDEEMGQLWKFVGKGFPPPHFSVLPRLPFLSPLPLLAFSPSALLVWQ